MEQEERHIHSKILTIIAIICEIGALVWPLDEDDWWLSVAAKKGGGGGWFERCIGLWIFYPKHYWDVEHSQDDRCLSSDYIGRVETNSLRSTSTGKQLRKTKLQDDMGKQLEITLWPEKRHLIGDEVVAGDIVAITSTMTFAARVDIFDNSSHKSRIPDVLQTVEHITRLRGLPAVQSTEPEEQTVTLLDLKLSTQQNIQGSRNFICDAKIAHIHEDRGWYYVLCSKCSNKLYPEQDSNNLILVCKDDDDITPNFRYCVNTTITDETGSANAVFFNDSMQEMVNISCKEMVTKHASTTDPRAIPHELQSAVDITTRLHLTLKNDGKIVVNNVSKGTPATERTGTSTFTPTTPLPKAAGSKRQMPETPGTSNQERIKQENMQTILECGNWLSFRLLLVSFAQPKLDPNHGHKYYYFCTFRC
ncbi:hypothetical protein CASFOL_001539 [Castilleja foliolosa]|uniref:Replication factor A C-terminal domain-containing protein n=1 Tax=Castilleja foliolosa TaxID=1961234 RepID=A0ABD3EK16_9LAMI